MPIGARRNLLTFRLSGIPEKPDFVGGWATHQAPALPGDGGARPRRSAEDGVQEQNVHSVRERPEVGVGRETNHQPAAVLLDDDQRFVGELLSVCLLYTSDAADERVRV